MAELGLHSINDEESSYPWLESWIEGLKKEEKLDQILSLYIVVLFEDIEKILTLLSMLSNFEKNYVSAIRGASVNRAIDIKPLVCLSNLEEITLEKISCTSNIYH